MSKAFFGKGFSMTVAGQEVVADADGYVDLSTVRATPELMVWRKEDPNAAASSSAAVAIEAVVQDGASVDTETIIDETEGGEA